MKRISFMLLLLAAALASYAQSGPPVSFYISVIDQAFKPTVTGTQRPYTVSFQQHPEIDPLMQQYGVIDMRKAYPASRLYHLKQIYLVTCTDASLMDALQNDHPEGFAGGYVDYPAVTFVTPNDYGKNVWTVNPNQFVNAQGKTQTYLDRINAKTAWDVSKGDSNIVIGMVDRQVYRNHPDLAGKVLSTYPNVASTSPLDTNSEKHGTRVAGLLAGRTDNNKGLAAIGWKCSIANSSGLKDSTNLQMSKDGIRIINNSWGELNPCTLVFSDTSRPALQNLYDEVYENGSFVVCGAGNGPDLLNGYTCTDSSFRFPASWDHNFSVTSVGHFHDTPTVYNASTFQYSTTDVHQRLPGLGTSTHNHNSRVDLCAPGYGMTVYDYSLGNPTDTFQQYYANDEGTSFASPLVAGTAGLILSLPGKSCLTPYQLEVLLKSSAYNISNLTANKPYAGKLGSGRLDAEKALTQAGSMLCNGTQATTMTISGIKISTRCFNGTASQPQLSATIANGTPPYSYRWMALADNRAILDNIYSATPLVTYLQANPFPNTRVVSFLLTVTDNSPIKKVASQRFYSVLKVPGMNPDHDLGIRDSEFDLLNDTNTSGTIDPRDWNIWGGPDVWNRRQLDPNGIVTDHQNPEYYLSNLGNNNYIHVRIKNMGCSSSPLPTASPSPRLRVYWTKASVGESWPGDWTVNDLIYLGATRPVGRQITTGLGVSIPSLAPGQDTVLRIAWKGVDPHDYDTTTGAAFHGCILARIEEKPVPNYGMYITEDTGYNTTNNVVRNNNIATRNMDVYNTNTNNINAPGGVIVANADKYAQIFSLDLRNDKASHPHWHGDLSEYITGTLYLGSLWDLWVAGGMQGSGFVKADREKRSISYDPSTVLRLDNLELPAGKKFEVKVQLTQRKGAQIYSPVTDHVYLRQLLPGAGIDGEDYVYGAFGFELNLEQNATPPRKQIPTSDMLQGASDDSYVVYPNPAHQYVVVQRQQPSDAAAAVRLLDITGRTVGSAQLPIGQNSVTLPLEGLSAGLYFVEVQGASSNHRYKVVIK